MLSSKPPIYVFGSIFMVRAQTFLIILLVHRFSSHFIYTSSQYRVLMNGCWQALCFFLGPSLRAGQGEDRHFFSRTRQYRSTSNHHSWESNLTQPLLEGLQGIITAQAISPFLTYLMHFA